MKKVLLSVLFILSAFPMMAQTTFNVTRFSQSGIEGRSEEVEDISHLRGKLILSSTAAVLIIDEFNKTYITKHYYGEKVADNGARISRWDAVDNEGDTCLIGLAVKGDVMDFFVKYQLKGKTVVFHYFYE